MRLDDALILVDVMVYVYIYGSIHRVFGATVIHLGLRVAGVTDLHTKIMAQGCPCLVREAWNPWSTASAATVRNLPSEVAKNVDRVLRSGLGLVGNWNLLF